MIAKKASVMLSVFRNFDRGMQRGRVFTLYFQVVPLLVGLSQNGDQIMFPASGATAKLFRGETAAEAERFCAADVAQRFAVSASCE